MLSAIVNACKTFLNHVKVTIKNFTKPETAVLANGTVSDIMRSRKDLMVENAILRQQFIVLNRQVKLPKFTNGDRLRLVLLSRLTQFWDSALHLVQPHTLLRWHRDLIKEMAEKNWLWGAEKIQGELLKLGIKVSKRTIQ
jgi:hypothetical protein